MATEAELRLALERLIRQLELADFVNKDGLKFSTNFAFVEAKRLLEK